MGWIQLVLAVAFSSEAAFSAEGYAVAGRVAFNEGACTEGGVAQLVARGWEGGSLEAEETLAVESAIDRQGAFELGFGSEVVAGWVCGWPSLDLWVRVPGCAHHRVDLVARSGNGRLYPGRRDDLGGVWLEPGSEVAWRVIAPGGAAVAGARVAVWRSSLQPGTDADRFGIAITDARGEVAIPGMGAGEALLIVDAPGFALARRSLVVPTPTGVAPRRLKLGAVTLEAARPLHGRVVDGQGQPLAGVTVRIGEHEPGVGGFVPVETAMTSRDGRFVSSRAPERGQRLPTWFAHTSLVIDAEKAGYRLVSAPRGHRQVGSGAVLDHELVLEPALRLTVEVRDQQGSPIAGARVGATGDRQSGGRGVEVGRPPPGCPPPAHATDEGGRFVLDGLPADRYRVVVEAPGYAAARAVAMLVEGAVTLPPIELRAIPTRVVELLVVEDDSSPVAGAGVWLGDDTCTTDLRGRCAIAHVPLGPRLELRVESPAGPSSTRSVEFDERDTGPLEVRLPPAPALYHLAGKVVDHRGRPVAGAGIHLGWERVAVSDTGGGFSLGSLAAGTHAVRVSHPGHGSVRLEDEVPPPGPLVAMLGAGVTLWVSISGVPEAGASELVVTAWSEDGESRRAAALGELGRYAIEHLTAGRWRVVGEWRGASFGTELLLEAEPHEASIALEMPRFVRVQGRLLLDGQAAHEPGELHFARREEGEVSAEGRLYQVRVAGGRFELPAIRPGAYDVSGFGPQGGFVRRVEIVGDAVITIDLGTGIVEGIVSGGAGHGLPGVLIEGFGEVYASHSHRFVAHTGADGRFTLGPLVAGRWTLHARPEAGSGYRGANTKLVVESGSVATVELVLEPGFALEVEARSPRNATPRELSLDLRPQGGGRPVHHWLELDQKGRGVWPDAPAGRYLLSAAAITGSTAEIAVEIPGPPAVIRLAALGAARLELAGGGDVAGACLPAGVDEVRGWLLAPDQGVATGEEPRTGVGWFDALTPGRWRFELRCVNELVWSADAVVAAFEVSTVTLLSGDLR